MDIIIADSVKCYFESTYGADGILLTDLTEKEIKLLSSIALSRGLQVLIMPK